MNKYFQKSFAAPGHEPARDTPEGELMTLTPKRFRSIV